MADTSLHRDQPHAPVVAALPGGVAPFEIGLMMMVDVDLAKCTRHGICESIADDVFEVQDDGTVLIRDNERPDSDRLRMGKAVTQCPAAALRLVD